MRPLGEGFAMHRASTMRLLSIALGTLAIAAPVGGVLHVLVVDGPVGRPRGLAAGRLVTSPARCST